MGKYKFESTFSRKKRVIRDVIIREPDADTPSDYDSELPLKRQVWLDGYKHLIEDMSKMVEALEKSDVFNESSITSKRGKLITNIVFDALKHLDTRHQEAVEVLEVIAKTKKGVYYNLDCINNMGRVDARNESALRNEGAFYSVADVTIGSIMRG